MFMICKFVTQSESIKTKHLFRVDMNFGINTF